ncbi:MAG: ethylbenzene dehydrogenase-related protein [Haloarculaceae archaeon]
MAEGRAAGPSPDRTRALTAALAVVVLASAVLAPMVAGRPANQIPIHHDPGEGAELAEPTSPEWEEAPPVTVPLSSAPSSVPEADSTSVPRAAVRAARTDERLFVRLSWADPTVDRSADDPRAFADAAAIQFPVNTSARPPIAMGSTRNAVNVWYWSASEGSEELLAGGAGSTTEFRNASVEVTTAREDGRWVLVYARDLRTGSPNRTSIALEQDVDVAFAVWNGSNMERSGRKAVSEWYHLPFGPGPQGPPYETILWTVAGLAIAVVASVTGAAVFRSREQERGDEP